MQGLTERLMQKHDKTRIRNRLAGLTGPVFVETLLLMMLGVVDTVMLGRYSDASVAAVGVCNQLFNLVILAFAMVSGGASVLCSQYFGARASRSVMQVIGVAFLCSLGIGLLFSLLMFFGGHQLLTLMDLRPELMPDGMSYMRIVGGGLFMAAVGMTMASILRSANMAGYPMRVSLIANLLNIIGNYTFIFGNFGMPELGVAGAATSTLVSRGVAMILLFGLVWRKLLRDFTLSLMRPFPTDKLHTMLTIGLPAMGEGFSYSLSQVTITYFINTLGTAALAARTYAMGIITFSFVFAMALGLSGSITAGHLIGEGHKQAAWLIGRYCIRIAIMVSLAIASVSALAGRTIMNLISSNPEVIDMVVLVLFIDVILEIGRAVNILCVNLLRAAGDVTYAFLVGLVVMWGVATGLGYCFGIALGWGLAGMWVAFAMDENIRAILLSRRWYKKIWMRRELIDRKRAE